MHHYLETLRVGDDSLKVEKTVKNARVREFHGQCPESRGDGGRIVTVIVMIFIYSKRKKQTTLGVFNSIQGRNIGLKGSQSGENEWTTWPTNMFTGESQKIRISDQDSRV